MIGREKSIPVFNAPIGNASNDRRICSATIRGSIAWMALTFRGGLTAGERVLYLGGFSVGSTLAMAALTAALAALSQVHRLPAALGERVPRFASALSMAVGGAWIAATL